MTGMVPTSPKDKSNASLAQGLMTSSPRLTYAVFRLWCERAVRAILDMPIETLTEAGDRRNAARTLQASGVKLDYYIVGEAGDPYTTIENYLSRGMTGHTDQGVPLSLLAEDFPPNEDLRAPASVLGYTFQWGPSGLDSVGTLRWPSAYPAEDHYEIGSFCDDAQGRRWMKTSVPTAPGQTSNFWLRIS